MTACAAGKASVGYAQGKHIFGTARVGDKGQIVIPKQARALFGIQPGDTLLLLGDEESGIVITKPEVVNDLACQVLERVNPSQHLEEEG